MGSNPFTVQEQKLLPEFVLHAFMNGNCIPHLLSAQPIALIIGDNKFVYGKDALGCGR